jgi:GAF domain-containing protein
MVEQAIIQPDLPPARAAALRRIASVLSRTTNTSLFLREALGELSALLKLSFALVVEIEHDELALMAAMPAVGTFTTPLPLKQLPEIAAVLAAGGAALIQPGADTALMRELKMVLPPISAAVLLFVPLIAQNKARGALMLGAAPGQYFEPEDTALVELVAGSLTTAVYVDRLSESMQRRNQHLAMLADIGAHVSSSLEPHEVYRRVVHKLKEYFRVEAGTLLLKDEATDELIFTMTLDGDEERFAGLRLPPGVGIVGHVAQSQEQYISNDVQHDSRFYRQVAEQLGLRCERILCVPMVVKENTVGVIELINKQDGPFTERDARRLAEAANIIGVAIENARLFEFVRQRRDRLERLIDRVQQGLPDDRLVTFLTHELATEDTLLGASFKNPYIVGVPVREPDMFFGRDRLVRELLSVLHQNSLLLHGERRIGKTTLLRQIELVLRGAADPRYSFKPIYIDLEGIAEGALFRHLIEEIIDGFGEPARALALNYHPRRRAYSGSEFQRDMRTLITALCGPQSDERLHRLVLLIDEADVMYGYDERVLQEFRRVFMKDYAVHLSVVFAAVDIQRKWQRYESPFYNLFQEIRIPPFTRVDTELLARTPVRGSYEYDEPAIDVIYRLSQGRPMQIQHLCLEAINFVRQHGRTLVTAEDIDYVGQHLKGSEPWS